LFNNILIVCIGNICRSPIAEGLLKHTLKTTDRQNCHIESAGLHALVGHRPDKKACQLMQEKGIDISEYQACQINRDMIRKSDLILVMESFQKKAIEQMEASAKGKTFRLGEWGEGDIPDPYQKDISFFRHVTSMIESATAKWVQRLP